MREDVHKVRVMDREVEKREINYDSGTKFTNAIASRVDLRTNTMRWEIAAIRNDLHCMRVIFTSWTTFRQEWVAYREQQQEISGADRRFFHFDIQKEFDSAQRLFVRTALAAAEPNSSRTGADPISYAFQKTEDRMAITQDDPCG